MRGVSRSTIYILAALSLALTLSVSAQPKNDRPPRNRPKEPPAIVKVIKTILRSLGDGMTTPTPTPTP
jgi:hypothetical protein